MQQTKADLEAVRRHKRPYSFFLLLNRESWIESWKTPQGAEFLKDLWRLQQTKADLEAVRRHKRSE